MAIVVNGEKIEDLEIQQEAERIRPEYEKAFADMDPKEREAQLFEWSKETLIEQALFRQEIKKSESAISNDKLDAILTKLKSEHKDPQDLYKHYGVENDEKIKEHLENLAKVRLKFEKLHKDLPKPSQDAIRQYYNENKEKFQTGERIRVGFISTQIDWQTNEQTAYESINNIYNELKNNVPFEILINKYNGQNRHLAFISRGQTPEEIEDVIFNLSVGQVSGIFRSRYGFHIAKIYEKIPSTVADFSQVKEQIEEILIKQNQEAAFYDFIDQLKDKAKIEEI